MSSKFVQRNPYIRTYIHKLSHYNMIIEIHKLQTIYLNKIQMQTITVYFLKCVIKQTNITYKDK